MPTYEYRCRDCSREFVVEARMQDPAPTAAPGCSFGGCGIEKKMSRTMGFVRGKAQAPAVSATPTVDIKKETNDPVHLCSKYCDHHAKP